MASKSIHQGIHGSIVEVKEMLWENSAWKGGIRGEQCNMDPKGSVLSVVGFGSLPRIHFRFEMIIQEVFRMIQNIQRSLAGLSSRSAEGQLGATLNC